jgi:hypothetical protein
MDHQARGDHRHPRLFTSLRSASMAWTRPPGRIATSSPCGASMPTNRTPGRPRHHPRDQLRMHRTSRQNDGALMAPQRTSDRVTHRNGHRLSVGHPGGHPSTGHSHAAHRQLPPQPAGARRGWSGPWPWWSCRPTWKRWCPQAGGWFLDSSGGYPQAEQVAGYLLGGTARQTACEESG